MTERLVDVLNQQETVLHTFPITVKASETDTSDARFEDKALSASAHAQLVPTEDLEKLSARMHVSRGGPVTPYGDSSDILMETKTDLDRIVREHAYLIWEQEGRPEGQAEEHTGAERVTNACASAPIAFGSRKGVPTVRPTGIGIGPADLRRFSGAYADDVR